MRFRDSLELDDDLPFIVPKVSTGERHLVGQPLRGNNYAVPAALPRYRGSKPFERSEYMELRDLNEPNTVLPAQPSFDCISPLDSFYVFPRYRTEWLVMLHSLMLKREPKLLTVAIQFKTGLSV